MNGQWLGRFSGTNIGTLFINLDDMGSYYAGNVFVYDDNTSLSFIYSYIRTLNKRTSCHLLISRPCIRRRAIHPTGITYLLSLRRMWSVRGAPKRNLSWTTGFSRSGEN
jgi:hypothetical protein